MLIQIVFFIFMLISVAALIIDMGYVRLTQSQMQNAADMAALEGLRQRDANAAMPGTCSSTPDPDENRRRAAANMIAWTFAEDYPCADAQTQPTLGDVASGNANLFLGAGPVVATDTIGADPLDQELGVNRRPPGRDYDARASTVYKPNLRSNLSQAKEGDMVSGTYGVSGAIQECPVNPNDPHWEDCRYNRADFTPADPGAASTANAFLVRLRRTNDFQGLDNTEGISSSGPALPLMLGRGTFVQQDPNSPNPNGYNPRLHGITVRATAIADARRALAVGLPHPELMPPVPGVASAAISLTCWRSLPQPFPLPLECLGSPAAQLVGAQITDPGLGSLTLPPEGAYLPIFDTAQNNRVVGFGFAGLAGGNIEPRFGYVATRNATALPATGLQIQGLSLLSIQDGVLLVPVIAR
jgi:hypothetical protein